jgi:Flp pilus assembly pilin Flp
VPHIFNSEQFTPVSSLCIEVLNPLNYNPPANKEAIMKKFFKNQKGQGIMEYVIISSLIGIACLAAMKSLGDVVKNRINNMKSEISNELTLKKQDK